MKNDEVNREEQAAAYSARSASAFSPAPTPPQTIDPEPVTVSSDAEPSSEAEPAPEMQSSPGAEPSPEAEAGVKADAGWEPEVLPESDLDLDPEPEPEVATAAETQADPDGTEVKDWPEAEPLPATPHFARKRSSPIPPEA